MALVSAAASSAGARRVPRARTPLLRRRRRGRGAGRLRGAETRVVLRGEGAQVSTGWPGEYGAPHHHELRKYWGGRGATRTPSPPPTTSSGTRSSSPACAASSATTLPTLTLLTSRAYELLWKLMLNVEKEEDSGFLSLNRAMSLNRSHSVEIDLSKELRPPSKPVLEQQVEAARLGLSAAESSAAKPRWRLVPTRREQAKWDRANKAATGGSDVLLRESRRERGDPKVLEAQSREQYFNLKQKLQILTLGIGGVGVVSAYVSYSPEIAVSFGAGLVGSLVYMRMLGNSIDSMADGAKGLVKGAIGQPRLLVPVALVMMYNRWNEILVPDYGFMHLELIPMLVGFFTYKIATFVQAIQDALFVVENPRV
ncbi:ATP synthase protein I [Ananas comosus]|uniref:ATP synthase protein I n=1 Tax=Ananas comosus TaxID=4615 RepID=A0A199UDY2_ANACO|nr:ATP synthase protein I [Ananas comosus]